MMILKVIDRYPCCFFSFRQLHCTITNYIFVYNLDFAVNLILLVVLLWSPKLEDSLLYLCPQQKDVRKWIQNLKNLFLSLLYYTCNVKRTFARFMINSGIILWINYEKIENEVKLIEVALETFKKLNYLGSFAQFHIKINFQFFYKIFPKMPASHGNPLF